MDTKMKKLTCESCGGNEFNILNSRESKCSFCGTLYLRDDARDAYRSIIPGASYSHISTSSSRIAVYGELR